MVLTVTLNPLLERRYSFDNIKFNSENRSAKKILKAGGKGINVSRQLNKLGIENIALTFTGGVNGKLFKEILRSEGISFTDIQIKEETRDAAIIIESSTNQLSTFFSENNFVNKVKFTREPQVVTFTLSYKLNNYKKQQGKNGQENGNGFEDDF